MHEAGDHLFVYGTLRPDLGTTPEAKLLLSNAEHLGSAVLCGALYLIDQYPGAVDSSDKTGCVIGDLFRLHENSQIFEQLDAYEGCSAADTHPHEYQRTVRNVTHQGRSLMAWVYLYAWPLEGRARVPSGDFAKLP